MNRKQKFNRNIAPVGIVFLIAFLFVLFYSFNSLQNTNSSIDAQASDGCVVLPPTQTIENYFKNIFQQNNGILDTNQIYCIQITQSAYNMGYKLAMQAYATKNKLVSDPYSANFVSWQKIYSTFSYGSPYERKPIEVWYQFLIDTRFHRIKIHASKVILGGKKASNAERNTVSNEVNKALTLIWGSYSKYVTPTNIYNTNKYLNIYFKFNRELKLPVRSVKPPVRRIKPPVQY